MKASLLLLALAANLMANPAMVERITPEALAEKQAAAPLGRLVPLAESELSASRPEQPSIIGQSTLLNFGGEWTLVPRGAVLHSPPALEDRLDGAPEGRFLPWLEFLAKNGGWISTAEISFQQATGEAPIDEDKVAFWSRQDRVIVAVHLRGPISVTAPLSNTTAKH